MCLCVYICTSGRPDIQELSGIQLTQVKLFSQCQRRTEINFMNYFPDFGANSGERDSTNFRSPFFVKAQVTLQSQSICPSVHDTSALLMNHLTAL